MSHELNGAATIPADPPPAPVRQPRRRPRRLAWPAIEARPRGLVSHRGRGPSGTPPRLSPAPSVSARASYGLRALRDAGCPGRRTWEAVQAAERSCRHAGQHAGGRTSDHWRNGRGL
jgi:hypothetical protein